MSAFWKTTCVSHRPWSVFHIGDRLCWSEITRGHLNASDTVIREFCLSIRRERSVGHRWVCL